MGQAKFLPGELSTPAVHLDGGRTASPARWELAAPGDRVISEVVVLGLLLMQQAMQARDIALEVEGLCPIVLLTLEEQAHRE